MTMTDLKMIAAALTMGLGACAATPGEQADAPTAPAASGDAVVELEVVVQSDEGPVLAALFADEASYADETPLRTLRIDVSGGFGSVTIEGLAPGSYAVKAFQDLDRDGALDRNALGIPSEPAAFSNGAKIRFGPPSWDAARFNAPAGRTVERLVFGR